MISSFILPSKKILIALKEGVHQLADPLVCGDLVGSQSYFGETAFTPRSLRGIMVEDFPRLNDALFFAQLQRKAVVLWDFERKDVPDDFIYSIAATTFLAGQCGSTFDLAWAAMDAGLLTPFSGVLSIHQRKARGQMRKEWVSPRGNLSVSFLLPQDPAFNYDGASVIVGMLVVAALRRLGYEIYLKWPNDLITASGKKIGGILLEERGGELLAGLGINLKETPEFESDGVALLPAVLSESAPQKKETIFPFALWRFLVEQIIIEYTKNIVGKKYSVILNNAENYLAWRGQLLALIEGNEPVLSGICKGIGENGGILIQPFGKDIYELSSGTIRLL